MTSWTTCLSVFLAATLAVASAAAAAGAARWCHEVRAGETLSAIARRHGTTPSRLVALNGARTTKVIQPGQILALPTLAQLREGTLRLGTPSLRAEPGSLRAENRAAVRDRLSRLRDLDAIARFRGLGLLVPVPDETRAFYVAGVRDAQQVTRPWTLEFLSTLGQASRELFGTRLRVTSLTRTADAQRRLRLVNASAAPAEGEVFSTHLTGAAVDLSTRDLAPDELAWMRVVLDRLSRRNLVHAIEEFHQPHFHVLVRRGYADYARRLPDPVLVGGC